MQNRERTLLVFSYYFPPLGMGGVQRVSKFIKYLPQFGWHPAAVTVKPVSYYAVDPSLLREIHHCPVHRTGSLDPARITRLLSGNSVIPDTRTTPSAGFPALLKRVIDRASIPDTKTGWVPFAALKGCHLLKNRGFSAILTTSPPLSGHLPGLVLARMLHFPWVADFRDHWLTESLVGGKAGEVHRTARRQLARWIVESADAVIAVSDPIRSSLASLSRTGAARMITIPNGFDPDDFEGKTAAAHARFTITYCGTMSSLLDPEPFFRAFALALERRPDIRERISIRLVGRATDIDPGAVVRRWGADCCTELRGYVSHDEAVSEMISADLLLFMLPDTCSSGMATGKVYEYLASGRPILAFSGACEARRILAEHPGCSLVTSRQTEAAAGIIIQRFDEWAGGGNTAVPLVFPDLQRFDRREHTRMLSRVLEELLYPSL
ncbi:glycosyltransferase [bacterium]|nr:glycosyltransferase [bacterium]